LRDRPARPRQFRWRGYTGGVLRVVLVVYLLAGCRQVLGLDDPDDSCLPFEQTFLADDTFVLPPGCAAVTVQAWGGGGAGGARNSGDSAAPGGNGGYATVRLEDQEGRTYVIKIGRGGACGSSAMAGGLYAGGAGGGSHGAGGGGAGMAPGGAGGTRASGGAGGDGGYGGGGGGGGGDSARGNGGGGATGLSDEEGLVHFVIAGGGGGAGASDQNGDLGAPGGHACTGYGGAPGGAAKSGSQSGGGGGGGACTCSGGTCTEVPTPQGSAGGAAGTASDCTPAQDGAPGKLVLRYP